MSGGCEVFYPYLLRIALFTKILVNNEDWICRYPSLGLCKTAARFLDVEEAFHLWLLMGTSWLNLRTSVVCKMFTIGSWTLQQKKKGWMKSGRLFTKGILNSFSFHGRCRLASSLYSKPWMISPGAPGFQDFSLWLRHLFEQELSVWYPHMTWGAVILMEMPTKLSIKS